MSLMTCFSPLRNHSLQLILVMGAWLIWELSPTTDRVCRPPSVIEQ